LPGGTWIGKVARHFGSCGQSLELCGAETVERRVPPGGSAEAIDAVSDGNSRLASRVTDGPQDQP